MADGQGEGPAAAIAARLRQLADWIACAMFAAVFVIFNYKIFTRYFEHDEAVWADEVLVILFIWIIFWANAFLVRDTEQITFDLVYRLLPDRGAALHRAGARSSWSAASLPGRCRVRSITSAFCGASTRRCSICRSISSIRASAYFLSP